MYHEHMPHQPHTSPAVALEEKYLAQNYAALPVVCTRAKGCRVWDEDGKEYLDFLGAYSAASFGHNNPYIRKTLTRQLDKLGVPSRAFHTDNLGPFAEKLCALTGLDKMLPMNTGAEAVETAIKAARRWGYQHKGIAKNKAEIIVSQGNFHGRTTTIVGFSSDAEYKSDFGPFDGGFREIPFGDITALEKAITPQTCAFLTEPILGEGGIVLPPKGWLKDVQNLCKKNNVLLILDEVQSGMGRTGQNFAFQHDIDRPDGLILGKALGGGIYPVSAFVATKEVMDVFNPGSHGSTFGGNPIACAIGLEAIRLLQEENLAQRSHILGQSLMEELQKIEAPFIKNIRGKGLWIGIEVDPNFISGKKLVLQLIEAGILTKETHETTLRLAPPLTIEQGDLDWALATIKDVFASVH